MWKKLRRICAEQRKQIESVFCAASLCKKHFSAGAVCPEGARSGRKGSVGKPQRVFRQTQQPPDGKSGGCFLLFTVCRDRPALWAEAEGADASVCDTSGCPDHARREWGGTPPED